MGPGVPLDKSGPKIGCSRLPRRNGSIYGTCVRELARTGRKPPRPDRPAFDALNTPRRGAAAAAWRCSTADPRPGGRPGTCGTPAKTAWCCAICWSTLLRIRCWLLHLLVARCSQSPKALMRSREGEGRRGACSSDEQLYGNALCSARDRAGLDQVWKKDTARTATALFIEAQRQRFGASCEYARRQPGRQLGAETDRSGADRMTFPAAQGEADDEAMLSAPA